MGLPVHASLQSCPELVHQKCSNVSEANCLFVHFDARFGVLSSVNCDPFFSLKDTDTEQVGQGAFLKQCYTLKAIKRHVGSQRILVNMHILYTQKLYLFLSFGVISNLL